MERGLVISLFIMNRLILLIMLLFAAFTVRAQTQQDNTVVSLIAGETPIEQQLTYAQKKAVKTLIVTGTLQPADYEYLRTTLMKQLSELNLKDAAIDTIPAKAFEGADAGSWNKMKLVCPKSLKHISEHAFNEAGCIECVLDGKFPTLGNYYRNSEDERHGLSSDIFFVPSENNEYLKLEDGILLSEDGAVLYNTPPSFKDLMGVKVINERLLEGCSFLTVFVIPETCDSIGNRAFAHTVRLAVSSWGYWTYGELKCKAKNPPKLGEDVFVDTDFLELGVPFGSEELYRNAYGWKNFKHIYGTDVFINT